LASRKGARKGETSEVGKQEEGKRERAERERRKEGRIGDDPPGVCRRRR